jgi:hypothetical protein
MALTIHNQTTGAISANLQNVVRSYENNSRISETRKTQVDNAQKQRQQPVSSGELRNFLSDEEKKVLHKAFGDDKLVVQGKSFIARNDPAVMIGSKLDIRL